MELDANSEHNQFRKSRRQVGLARNLISESWRAVLIAATCCVALASLSRCKINRRGWFCSAPRLAASKRAPRRGERASLTFTLAHAVPPGTVLLGRFYTRDWPSAEDDERTSASADANFSPRRQRPRNRSLLRSAFFSPFPRSFLIARHFLHSLAYWDKSWQLL